MAQIRASTCLALASSGAAFSAPNRKSSPRVLSAPAFGNFAGASGSFFCCLGLVPKSCDSAATGVIAAIAEASISIRPRGVARNLKAMSESLDAAKAACKADTRQRPVMNREIRSALKLDRPCESRLGSTLARLEAALDLVDHINPALAAD